MSAGVKPAMSNHENQESHPQAAPARSSDRSNRERGRRRHRPFPKHLEASINMEELRELIGLITDNALTDFELEREGFHVKIGRNLFPELAPSAGALPESVDKQSGAIAQTGSAVQSIPTTAPRHPGAQAEEAAAEDKHLHLIPSPIVGTFYRAASPTAASFVRIGSQVEPNTVVCIIEAMKLMNEIQAETTGEVV